MLGSRSVLSFSSEISVGFEARPGHLQKDLAKAHDPAAIQAVEVPWFVIPEIR
jgi:hypothetical protein